MKKNHVSRLLDQMKPNPTPGHGSRKKTGGAIRRSEVFCNPTLANLLWQ
jgi:hypothetical protein